MAEDHQQPAQLGWRKPGWAWALSAFALAGPINPLALIGAAYPMAGSDFVSTWLLGAAACSIAAGVSIASWVAPSPTIQRTLGVLTACVGVGALVLAMLAGLTLPAEVGLVDRLNLGLAILVMALGAGGAVAISAFAIVRFVALRPKRRRRSNPSRDRIVQPREVGAPSPETSV